MARLALGTALAFVVWVSVLAFPFHYLFQTVPDVVAEKPMAHLDKSDVEQGSLGKERHAILVEETRLYVAQHPEAPPAMAVGKQLAPEAFLNEELKKRHAHWRVRNVHGLDALIYDVS